MTERNLNARFRVALMLLAATSFVAIVLAGIALYARFTQGNTNRDANNRVWHAVICQVEKSVAKSHLPPAHLRAALRFYDHLLTADVQTDGCGLIKKGTP
jgi:hypothetical protein